MKGCMELSVLYAFDIELGEPICASVFPGNTPDCKAYGEFIRTHNLKRGIIVGDKGFPSNVIAEYLEKNKDLHYFNPLKRTSVYIEKYELLKYEECFSVGDNYVLCKRVYIVEEKKYLFSFVNSGMSVKEYTCFVASASKHKNFDFEKYSQKRDAFGLILFESDLDMTLAEAYNVYKSRWKLEVVFGYYKADITQNQTNVQSDFSVMGMEFINFLSSLLTCRIVEKAQKAGLLKQVTYGVLMDDLNVVRRDVKNTPDNTMNKLKKDDPYWFHVSNIAMEEMIQLGLVESDETTESKAKKGRPPKRTEKETESSSTTTTTTTSSSSSSSSCNTGTEPKETGEHIENVTDVKRPRGRPPKTRDNSSEVVKRPRGRPRKERTDEEKPKRPRGRPRKERTEEEKPKRPRGRPRKTPS